MFVFNLQKSIVYNKIKGNVEFHFVVVSLMKAKVDSHIPETAQTLQPHRNLFYYIIGDEKPQWPRGSRCCLPAERSRARIPGEVFQKILLQ